MKAKKVLKRLKRVEALLSGVLHQYARGNGQMRDLLTSAKSSVSSAKEAIGHPEQPSTAGKPLAKAGGASQKPATGPIRKRSARTARKRRSAATRTTDRIVAARKAVTKARKRTVPKAAKRNLKRGVSNTKAKRAKAGVTSRGAFSRAAEQPAIRGSSGALPTASNQPVAGVVGKPAMNNTMATRGKQPDRSMEPAPKPSVDAGGLGGQPFRQG